MKCLCGNVVAGTLLSGAAAELIGNMSNYEYPVSEDITEPAEAAQDPNKRAREQALIAAQANFGWERALDFGCGRGGNFPVLAAAGSGRDKHVLGVDLDAERAAQAAASAVALQGATFETMQGGVETVERWPPERRFDLILLCQIIGHTPTAEATRILTALRARLNPGGRFIICYPFVTPAAAESLDAPDDEDYFHLVDFKASDLHAFRRRLTRDAFDAAARAPAAGLLPVRCFPVPRARWRLGDALPSPGTTPDAIASCLPGLMLRSTLYSVHHVVEGSGEAAIGDMATAAQS